MEVPFKYLIEHHVESITDIKLIFKVRIKLSTDFIAQLE